MSYTPLATQRHTCAVAAAITIAKKLQRWPTPLYADFPTPAEAWGSVREQVRRWSLQLWGTQGIRSLDAVANPVHGTEPADPQWFWLACQDLMAEVAELMEPYPSAPRDTRNYVGFDGGSLAGFTVNGLSELLASMGLVALDRAALKEIGCTDMCSLELLSALRKRDARVLVLLAMREDLQSGHGIPTTTSEGSYGHWVYLGDKHGDSAFFKDSDHTPGSDTEPWREFRFDILQNSFAVFGHRALVVQP